MMIVERDIGRLVKYTFDMGGTGELLSLSLDVPPWDDLHEVSPQELHLTGLVNTDAVADVLPEGRVTDRAVAPRKSTSKQERIVSSSDDERSRQHPNPPRRSKPACRPAKLPLWPPGTK
jgi:hypothetical protein